MQKLNPKAVWLFFWMYLIQYLFVLFLFVPFLIYFVLDTLSTLSVKGGSLSVTIAGFLTNFLLFCFFCLIIWLIIIWVFAKLAYEYYGYELRQDVIRIEYGVIWKRYVSIPYSRVQNVDITRGVLERLLNLSSLHIQTAGATSASLGAMAEGRIPGLSVETAEQLREEIIKRANQTRTQERIGL